MTKAATAKSDLEILFPERKLTIGDRTFTFKPFTLKNFRSFVAIIGQNQTLIFNYITKSDDSLTLAGLIVSSRDLLENGIDLIIATSDITPEYLDEVSNSDFMRILETAIALSSEEIKKFGSCLTSLIPEVVIAVPTEPKAGS